MRGVILNELDILNNILENDYMDNKKPLSCLRILCKYYFKKGLNKEEILKKLDKYMSKNYNGYNEDNWYGKLKGLIKTVQKYNNFEIINVNEISITEYEWNKILELNDKQLERVAFILLVYQKINQIKNPNSNGWINQTLTDIFSESIIRANNIEKGRILHKLYSLKYIEQKNTCDATELKLKHTYNSSNVKININNFNNVISYYYEYRNNERWKECNVCGKRFKMNNNDYSSMYCGKCRKIIKNELSKNGMKKLRSKKC